MLLPHNMLHMATVATCVCFLLLLLTSAFTAAAAIIAPTTTTATTTITAAALKFNSEIIGATSLAAAAAGAVAFAADTQVDANIAHSTDAYNFDSNRHSSSSSSSSGGGSFNDNSSRMLSNGDGGNVGDVGNADVDSFGDSAGVGVGDVDVDGHGYGTAGKSEQLIAKSANLLLLDELQQHANAKNVNLTRHHDGDMFYANGVSNCNVDTCVGLSSGTATLKDQSGERDEIIGTLAGGTNSGQELFIRRNKMKSTQKSNANGESCQCRCLPYLSTYREDLGICVDDIHECTLSPFVSGSSSEKIPFVFLPLRGQIIYPSREISFPNIRTPVCAVTGAQYLSTNGWSELRNPLDTDYPFRMFRDEGRTFLQWLGESDLRKKMQGRLIVVHLVCRDMAVALNITKKEKIRPHKNVFSPCVAFRVNGSPIKFTHNVSEVLFQSEPTTTLAATSDGMSTREYIVIGACSLLLGLIYVSSVFLYLHMRKRKGREQSTMRNSLNDLTNDINYPKNDQVTFGAPFNRTGSIYSATSLNTLNEPRSRGSIGSMKEEMGIIKNNPLLQHFPQLSEHNSGFTSDISNSNSECEMDGGFHDKLKQSIFNRTQLQTSALVHPQFNASTSNGNNSPKCTHLNGNNNNNYQSNDDDEIEQTSSSPTQENECLPVENVSIIEDMMTEEKLENLRAMVNGNVRKKLYFNPAYFEPQLLAQPPPAAIEFLQKIREVIAIAKYKMATKRYQPSLIMIPEEIPLGSNTPSIYGSQLQAKQECEACVNNRCNGHVKNCGDKRNSIEMWLQTVQAKENQNSSQNITLDTEKIEKSNDPKTKLEIKNATDKQKYQDIRKLSPPKTPTAKKLDKRIPHVNNTNNHNTNINNNNNNNNFGKRNSPRKEITPPKQRPPPPPTPKKPTTHATHSSTKVNNNNNPNNIDNNNKQSDCKNDNAHHYHHHHCCPNAHTTSATTPTSASINRLIENVSALTAAASLYGFAETGNEIYNNPKFSLHDSPNNSQRSRNSSQRSKASRKRLEVLDHYAAASTPTSLTSADRQHYEMLRNMKQVPDMLYDAIARGYNASITNTGSFHLDIPTPDYDSTLEKKVKDIYGNTQSSGAPSVPTPDYSTLSRKSLKQYQPDSPVYRRKSPQYLIVDYETDSLERLEVTKRKSSQSSSSPSSDVSSQLSPSLSTALPLEEELEISHTVYDKIDGFRKEGDVKKKVTTAKTENGNKKRKDVSARIKYDTPFRGSMTIELQHEPPSDFDQTTDTDADTLNRKADVTKQQSFCDANSWSNQQRKSQLNNSLTELNNQPMSMPANINANDNNSNNNNSSNATFVLRSSNSFRSQPSLRSHSPVYESRVELRTHQSLKIKDDKRPSIDSLKRIFQAPLMRQNSQNSCKCGGQYALLGAESLTEQGRLLTLEAKQKRRQRVIEQKAKSSVVEITQAPHSNKTTIKISTPKANRAAIPFKRLSEPNVKDNTNQHNNLHLNNNNNINKSIDNISSSSSSSNNFNGTKMLQSSGTKIYCDSTKNTTNVSGSIYEPMNLRNSYNSNNNKNNNNNNKNNNSNAFNENSKKQMQALHTIQMKRARRSPPPPPPPPPLNENSKISTNAQHQQQQQQLQQRNHRITDQRDSYRHHYQNQNQYTNHSFQAEEETHSNHSESTEITGTSDTINSCNNTLTSDLTTGHKTSPDLNERTHCNANGDKGVVDIANKINQRASPLNESPRMRKKLKDNEDYGAIFNTKINGLRNDYSLTKYLNRRKSQEQHVKDPTTVTSKDNAIQSEDEQPRENSNQETKHQLQPQQPQQQQQQQQQTPNSENDALNNKVELVSINSNSNRSSSRLSDRTKELYRNAGVPVGIAYPQRSTTNSSNSTTTTVQTVYRCEIEPIQLTHGMQIAMGLKDRAKKAKDLKNAWKKFVSMATAKFSPTQSPAPSIDKKSTNFIEVLERDEGISSLIDENAQVSSTPKNHYSAPNSQNYYEQRFGGAQRTQELDSGYMSADSSEVYKRSFYDRYNFKKLTERERVVRIENVRQSIVNGNNQHKQHQQHQQQQQQHQLHQQQQPKQLSTRRVNAAKRFEDFEHLNDEMPNVVQNVNGHDVNGLISDSSDSDKTLTDSNERPTSRRRRHKNNGRAYSTTDDDDDDEQSKSGSVYGSSETDGETNAEEMWESGAESIETHSVLYKNIRKN